MSYYTMYHISMYSSVFNLNMSVEHPMITLELGGTYFFNGHLHHLTLSIAWFTMMIMMASSLNPTITTNGARRLGEKRNLHPSRQFWNLGSSERDPITSRYKGGPSIVAVVRAALPLTPSEIMLHHR